MSLFTTEGTEPRFIALLDIGSASVTGTILFSPHHDEPTVVWSTQEQILLKQITSRGNTGKHLISALMNVVLELGQDGLQALRADHPRAKIERLQVSVAAPWSYTITKQARYEKEQSFQFTNTLYEDLIHKLEQTVTEELHEHEVSDHLGLTVASRTITSILANGYQVAAPHRQPIESLYLSLSNTVIQNYLDEAIRDAHNKVVPQSELQISSFILLLYYVIQELHQEMQEYCIINQTMEATELGIVRNGELVYSTHEPYGIVTLGRDLSEPFGVSLEEVYGFIQAGDFTHRYEKLSTEKQAAVDSILATYHATISELLKQTGDSFTIPKTIYIHTASCTYDFFAEHVEAGATSATGLHHIVHNIDQEVLAKVTGLQPNHSDRSCVELISGFYAHTHKINPRFIPR